jgi:hypothetical protein
VDLAWRRKGGAPFASGGVGSGPGLSEIGLRLRAGDRRGMHAPPDEDKLTSTSPHPDQTAKSEYCA